MAIKLMAKLQLFFETAKNFLIFSKLYIYFEVEAYHFTASFNPSRILYFG